MKVFAYKNKNGLFLCQNVIDDIDRAIYNKYVSERTRSEGQLCDCEHLLLLLTTQVWFSAPVLGGAQLPGTPVPRIRRHLRVSLGIANICAHTRAHTQVNKNNENDYFKNAEQANVFPGRSFRYGGNLESWTDRLVSRRDWS